MPYKSPESMSQAATAVASEEVGRRAADRHEVVNVHRFCSTTQMKATLQQEASNTSTGKKVRVAFVCVPPEIIDNLHETDDIKHLDYYDKDTSLVIFQMASRLHNLAVEGMRKLLHEVLTDVKMSKCFVTMCNAVEPHDAEASKGKAPDVGCYMKQKYAQGLPTASWPQIVVEVGTSETHPKLQADARYWLEEGDPAVRWALTLKFFKHRVLLESWGLNKEKELASQGSMEAQWHGGDLVGHALGELTVPFKTVFLRDPDLDHEPENVRLTTNSFLQMLRWISEQDREAGEAVVETETRKRTEEGWPERELGTADTVWTSPDPEEKFEPSWSSYL
ncbi:hypothetical protein KEM56_005601 [Ascosphaera pollenicola]|nr:hypothetical protein KEM56_005601 [Ascosphaera pollenicola]